MEKTYYTGSMQRFIREVRSAGFDINHNVFFSNPEALRGLSGIVKIVDLGPPEISQPIIKEVRMLGIKIVLFCMIGRYG